MLRRFFRWPHSLATAPEFTSRKIPSSRSIHVIYRGHVSLFSRSSLRNSHKCNDLVSEKTSKTEAFYFNVLKKCQNKFDCFVNERLLIKQLRPCLNLQSDSIRLCQSNDYGLLVTLEMAYLTQFPLTMAPRCQPKRRTILSLVFACIWLLISHQKSLGGAFIWYFVLQLLISAKEM